MIETDPIVARQVLKLSRPFVLGIIVRQLTGSQSLLYIQMDTSADGLLKCVSTGSMYGSIRAKHIFKANIWESGYLKS